jgi:uncharacterized alpha-E superfamily protein
MFWLGRYTERAADVTRMLEVAHHAQLERPPDAARAVWAGLLKVLFVERAFSERYGDISTENVVRFLVFDRDNPASVAYSIMDARTNVMNVRDIVPAELLESVNDLYGRVMSGQLERFMPQLHEIFEVVAAGSARISGAIHVAMSREDEFRFLTIGQLLERAEMTGRLIQVNRRAEDPSTWMSVLRSISGFHAFIRKRGPLAPASAVVRFLLQEETFPFSVLHCLLAAGEHAHAVSGTGTWKSPRELGRLSSQLQYAELPPPGSDALSEMLEQLEVDIRRVSELIHEDLFQFGGDPAQYSFEAR